MIKVHTLAGFCLALLLAFPVRTYLHPMVPISIITPIYIILLFVLYGTYFINRFTHQNIFVRITVFDVLIYTLFFVYGFRLIYNVYVEEIYQTSFNSKSPFLIYYFAFMVFPYIVGRTIAFNRLNFKQFMNFILLFLFLGLSYSFYRNVIVGMKYAYGRFMANELLDPIIYGNLALSLLIVLFVLYERGRCLVYNMRMFFLFLLGLVSLVMSNSRGPIVAIAFLTIIWLLKNANLKRIIMFFGLSIVGLSLLVFILRYFEESFNSTFIERITSIVKFDGTNKTGRDSFYIQGLDMFSNHWFIGRSILFISGDLEGGYAHNFFIEVLMSTGIIGGATYLFTHSILIYQAVTLIGKESKYKLFAYLFLQYFLISMFSRTLIVLPEYWLLAGALFSTYKLEKT